MTALSDTLTRAFARKPVDLVRLTVSPTQPDIEGFGAPTIANKGMVGSVTVSDGNEATATPMTFAPLQTTTGVGSYVTVKVNGRQQEVGNGVKTKTCYFSGDGGATARLITQIQAADKLHWNGSIATFELDANDRITFLYYVLVAGSGSPAPDAVFLFSSREAEPINLQLGLDVRPYLMRVTGRPNRIIPDRALTERTSITATFSEDEDAPPLPVDSFITTTGGSFWRRLVAAQPDYVGSKMEVFRGFISPGFSLSDFDQIFFGRLEEINLSANGTVSIVAKDNLVLFDRETPSKIANDNLLTLAALATDSTLSVTRANEITDPTSLDSKDLFPVTLRIETEDIAISAVQLATNNVIVQGNFIDKSEDFSNALWVKSVGATVNPNIFVGPFGGLGQADQIDFVSVGDTVEQDSGFVIDTGPCWVSSFWLKAASAALVGTMTIEIFDVGAESEKVTLQITLTQNWQRFDVSKFFTLLPANVGVRIKRDTGDVASVVAFGAALNRGTLIREFYVGTDGNSGADAGRGAFGSTAALHILGTAYSEIGIYRQHLTDTGVHPTFAVQDMLNRGGIKDAEIDQSTFDSEFNFTQITQMKRAGGNEITEPARLSQHIEEIRRQSLLDLWVSESGLVRVKLIFRIVLPGEPIKRINDEENIIFKSASVNGNRESRVTRAIIFWDQLPGTTGDDRSDFANAQIFFDPTIEALSGAKSKTIFGKWIKNQADAAALAGRIVSRFKRGARILSTSLDLKDSPDFDVGDQISVDTKDILTAVGSSASRVFKFFGVTFRDFKKKEGQIKIECTEASGLKYAIITPVLGIANPAAPFPDFPAANDQERQYGFIGDANNLVGAGEDGYYIL